MSTYVSLYRQTLAERQSLYNAGLATGKFTPFIYPVDTLPALCLLLAIVGSPRLPTALSKPFRYAMCGGVVAGCYVCMHGQRMLGFASGYGIGLPCVWGIIMSVVLLILHDPGKDYYRLEARYEQIHVADDSRANGTVAKKSNMNGGVDVRKRMVYSMNGSTTPPVDPPKPAQASEASQAYRLVWQPFPNDLYHCLDWTLDLMTAFRGVNWNFRIPTLPKIDAPLSAGEQPSTHLSKEALSKSSALTAVPVSTLNQMFRTATIDMIFWYLLIDLLKTTMMTDPYFIGIAPLSSPTPWSWLATLNDTIPIATRFVRLCVSMLGVVTALSLIYCLSPLFFALVLPYLAGPTRLSALTKAPLLEPSLYVPYWGPMFHTITHKGLAGMWGQWWHQMFRYGISEPSKPLVALLGLDRRSQLARAIQLFVAFGLSGSIHAAASYTTFSIRGSKPLHPLLFFLSQALGITIQTALAKFLVAKLNPPAAMRRFSNFGSTLVWLYFTGPLLADDFARCGIWLFEPIPVSPLRGLGFGPGGVDEGWWCWFAPEGGKTVGFWNGDRWWEHGLAIY